MNNLQRNLSLFTIFFCLFSSTFHLGEVSAYGYGVAFPPSFASPLSLQQQRVNLVGVVGEKEDDDRPASKVISVDEFGAKADGTTDDNEAFEKAWDEACSSEQDVALVVPEEKSYRLKPITFTGPCKSNISVEIHGTIEASEDPSDYKDDLRHWLVFDSVENLLVEGGGTIHGNGKTWWEKSCKKNKHKHCTGAPTALTFKENKNLVVSDLKLQDSQQMHLSFDTCVDVVASNIIITAPGDSPNTDGIHVTNTQNILISDSTIGTGDDCISIVSGSEMVTVRNVTCGPGHGISIGSLGKGNSADYVSGVFVNGAKLSGTTNGVRIKTWQGGSGYAENIVFKDVVMENVKNPIIIDQNYCDQEGPCKEQESAVQVKQVTYQNIQGTSASDVSIKFDCSKSHPCEGIQLENIDLKGEGDDAVTATCNNVQAKIKKNVSPSCSSGLDRRNLMAWLLGKLRGH